MAWNGKCLKLISHIFVCFFVRFSVLYKSKCFVLLYDWIRQIFFVASNEIWCLTFLCLVNWIQSWFFFFCVSELNSWKIDKSSFIFFENGWKDWFPWKYELASKGSVYRLLGHIVRIISGKKIGLCEVQFVFYFNWLLLEV